MDCQFFQKTDASCCPPSVTQSDVKFSVHSLFHTGHWTTFYLYKLTAFCVCQLIMKLVWLETVKCKSKRKKIKEKHSTRKWILTALLYISHLFISKATSSPTACRHGARTLPVFPLPVRWTRRFSCLRPSSWKREEAVTSGTERWRVRDRRR